VHTGADGTYRLHGVMSEIPLLVSAEGPWITGSASPPVTVERNEAKKGIDLVVAPAGGVRVVLGGTESEAERDGWTLTLRQGSTVRSADFSAGVAQVTGVTPGTWTASAFHMYGDEAHRRPAPPSCTVEIVAGRLAQVELLVQ
jgi:hypothetical protein